MKKVKFMSFFTMNKIKSQSYLVYKWLFFFLNMPRFRFSFRHARKQLVIGASVGLGTSLKTTEEYVPKPPVYFEPSHCKLKKNTYWLQNVPNVLPDPEFPDKVDVAIIGAGLSGVSVLYHLLQTQIAENDNNSLKIVLLDTRAIAHGATGSNGGVACPAGDIIDFKFEQKSIKDLKLMLKTLKIEDEVEYENKSSIKLCTKGYPTSISIFNEFCYDFLMIHILTDKKHFY